MYEFKKKHLHKSLNYKGYRDLVDSLLEQNKTTGSNHSDKMLEYSRLNVHRMSRIDRTTKLTSETTQALGELNHNLCWLVLSEAWCGDAAQNLPIIAKMADSTSYVSLKILLRDENPDIMGAFLTNGGRVLGVTALGDTLKEAQTKAYAACEKIHFENKYYRKDIGKDLLSKY